MHRKPESLSFGRVLRKGRGRQCVGPSGEGEQKAVVSSPFPT